MEELDFLKDYQDDKEVMAWINYILENALIRKSAIMTLTWHSKT